MGYHVARFVRSGRQLMSKHPRQHLWGFWFLIALGVMMSPCAGWSDAFGASADGWFSEVSLTSRWVTNNGVTGGVIPPMIEISGLSADQSVGLVAVNLNTRPVDRLVVLQVISVQPGAEVRLVTPSAWPAQVLPGNPAPAGVITNTGTTFTSATQHAWLLFDTPVSLVTGVKITSQTHLLNGINLLDVLNLGPASTTPYQTGQDVIDLNAEGGGLVWARPNDVNNAPSATTLIGPPNSFNQITGINPTYQLNPGQYNLVWTPQAVPEPGSALVLGIGGACLLLRRRGPRRARSTIGL